MNAHLSVPAYDSKPNQPSSLSFPIITGELKKNLNFQGLVFTDGLGMETITKHFKPGNLEYEAFLAGNDILLCPLDVPQAVNYIEQAIKDGRITEKDLNDRVLKILKAKEWAFSKQEDYKKSKEMQQPDSYITRTQAYDLQKKLYCNAITTAKNTTPLSSFSPQSSCIVQIGTMPDNVFANNLKQQNYMIQNYSATLNDEEFEECLNKTKNNNKIIISIGEMNKFAKQQYGIASNTISLIKKLKEMGKEITVVVFGTPYSLSYFDQADNILVAYEDAQAAQEASVDILCAKVQPKGILPVKIV